MKKMKAILSVLLCLLMVWACFAPAAAIGAESGKTTVAVKAPRNLSGTQAPAAVDTTLPWDDLFAAVDSVIFTDVERVNVSALAIPFSADNWNYIQDHINDDPKLLGIYDVSFTLTGMQSDPDTVIKEVYYTGDYEANAAKRAECEEAIFQLMYGIKDNEDLSDYDKCLLLHDRLAALVAYDSDNLAANTVPADSHNAYGALVSHIAVCQGYAMAYGWMLDLLGIENYYIASSAQTSNHGWCKVKLDGKWYYVDVTFDDPTYDIPGRVHHTSFLVPWETLFNSHSSSAATSGAAASDYDSTITDTTYAESFDKLSESEIVKIGGAYYFLDHTTAPAKLMKRTLNGDTYTDTMLVELNTKEATYQETNGNTTTTSSFAFDAKMTAIGSKIIYTDGKQLFAYDVNAETPAPQELFTLADNDPIMEGFTEKQIGLCVLHGLKQVDGKLYVTAYYNSNFNAEILANYTIEIDFCDHASKVLLDGKESTSCTEAGYAEYICPDCRKLWTEDTPAGSHNLVLDSTLTVPATCASYASYTYKCTECSYTEVRTGDAFDPNNHPEAGLENHGATASTCKTQGYSAGVYCSTCHTYISGHELQELNSDNHENTVVTKEAFPATCTTDGWTQEVKCLACNTVVSESVPIGKKGHAMEITVVPPTCTTRGYTLHKCSRCPLEEKTDYVDALNHPEDQRIQVAATSGSCVEDGCSAGVFCNACKTFISGHYSTGKNTNNHVGGWETCSAAPTCTEDGYTDAKKCLGCGYVDTSVGTVQKALGHTWDEGKVLKEATCTDTGKRKYTCTTCGSTYVDVLDKLGHLDLDNNNICDRCEKNLNEDACPYCNQIHTGLFAPLTNFFHKILYLFFGPKKAK